MSKMGVSLIRVGAGHTWQSQVEGCPNQKDQPHDLGWELGISWYQLTWLLSLAAWAIILMNAAPVKTLDSKTLVNFMHWWSPCTVVHWSWEGNVSEHKLKVMLGWLPDSALCISSSGWLPVSFPCNNHNHEYSWFQWILVFLNYGISEWFWRPLNLQLNEVRLVLWRTVPSDLAVWLTPYREHSKEEEKTMY